MIVIRNFASYMRQKRGVFKLGLVGVTVGALVGTGYSIQQLNKPKGHIVNERLEVPVMKRGEIPKIEPTRKVVK